MARINRSEYAAMFGPTTGDQVRLADTNLWAEIENDFAVYGDECLHGGGKTLRDGMGMKAGKVNAGDHGGWTSSSGKRMDGEMIAGRKDATWRNYRCVA